MNRATKEFEHFVVKHCITKFFSWRMGTVHPNANLSLIQPFVIHSYTTAYYSLYAQLHGWPYWMVRNLQYLIMIWVRGC